MTTEITQDKVRSVLSTKNVLIVGLGGVGAYVADTLARSGIGSLTIVDADTVSLTNINRQLPALPDTIGQLKIKVIEERLKKINPSIKVTGIAEFLQGDAIAKIVKENKYDYVVDCIDTVSPKVYLIKSAVEAGVPVVSSFGAGGRLDPTKILISDIEHTHEDTFGRIVRYRLHKHGIKNGIICVFSTETADKQALMFQNDRFKKSSFGTISYITSIFGLKCAEAVIRGLMGDKFNSK